MINQRSVTLVFTAIKKTTEKPIFHSGMVIVHL